MMNDKFTNIPNPDDESIARKLNKVSEQTQASDRFAAELEAKLRNAHRPRAVWFNQVSPVLRWVAVMALLALVLSWSIKTLIPKPQPAISNTPGLPVVTTNTPQPEILPDASPIPSAEAVGYDFRGGKVFLGGPLPDAPQKAHLYLLNKDGPVSREQAQALANRFGIQGETYTEPNYVFNTTNYVISDGKQRLSVYSDRYFSYAADVARNRVNPNGVPNENAEAKLHEFLQARGMDFPFEIQATDYYGGYSVRPLAPNSIPMQYESFTWPPLRVTFDENGEVLNIDATLLALDQNPVGEFDILTAQEAFDLMRNDNAMGGKTEFMHSSNIKPQEWYRSYPDNQPVTISGYISSNPAVDPGKPPLLFIDGVSLTGNTSGMESLMDYSFVMATGQYIVENGIRKFQVESWDRNVNEAYVSGILSRQGDRTVITSDNGSGKQYPLIDPPADLPIGTQLPDSSLAVSGLILNDEFSWTYIQYFESMGGGGGGGGGGGLGFYKLNLSGPPVPFPTPASQPDPTQGFAEYVVKEGDTILGIAESFGLGRTPEKIFQANNLQSGGALTPGTVLIIPLEAVSQGPSEYTVQEGDTVASIASKYGISISELGNANNLNDQYIIIVGQKLVIPGEELPEKNVEDLRGYLNISIHDHGDGTSTKEYALDVNMPDGGSTLYKLDGQNLGELEPYSGLPILVSGTLRGGNLVMESYKIPYPDLHFQILKGTQKVEQVGGLNVVTFTTEEGKSYVEYMATNNFPKEQEITGYQGDLIEQEVLIIPDETFGGLPVAHVFQSAMIQANGPAMEVQANAIHTYTDSNDPGLAPETALPSLTIDQVELAYYVPNPYYQAASDPNYEQRSHYIQPVWHFRGHYEDGSSVDFMIQALKKEFLLPEVSPGLSPG